MNEFVLAVIPMSFIALPVFDLLGMFQSAIVSEQIAYDIARYASLADVRGDQAEDYRILREPESTLGVVFDWSGCNHVSRIESRHSVTFWPETILIAVTGRASCEK